MGITTFDTLKFVRRLEEAGMTTELAEVQAQVLNEAFNVNLETLVTGDQLSARFAEQDARIDKMFAEQDARIDARFARVEAKIQFLIWSQAIITVAVLIPLFERMMAL